MNMKKVVLVVGGFIIVIALIASLVGGDADIPEPEPTALPTAVKTLQEQVEDCLDPWDGHHNGFEDQVRPLLNDEESMQVHNTYYGTAESEPDKVSIRMVYSALNALGGRVKAEANGVLNYKTCAVVMLTTGLE